MTTCSPKPHRLIFICMLALSLCAQASNVTIGSSEEEVIAALGKPDGNLSAGTTRILSYGEARVKLKHGKVVSVSPGLSASLANRTQDKDLIEANRARGLINYRGEWMTPEQKKALMYREFEARNQAASVSAAEKGLWLTDYNTALKLAKSQNKKLLLNFTGSDWCGWCIKLDNEVFSQSKFKEYAADNYILVKLDFPRRSKLPADLEKQNDTLAKKYKVRGFPTVLVLNSNGKVHKQGGYVKGGPDNFLASIR